MFSVKTFLSMLGTVPRGGRIANQIPVDILEDPALNEAIKIVSSSGDAAVYRIAPAEL